jgi:hypothetical protein
MYASDLGLAAQARFHTCIHTCTHTCIHTGTNRPPRRHGTAAYLHTHTHIHAHIHRYSSCTVSIIYTSYMYGSMYLHVPTSDQQIQHPVQALTTDVTNSSSLPPTSQRYFTTLGFASLHAFMRQVSPSW